MAQNDQLAQAIMLLAQNLAQNRPPQPDPAGEMFKKLAQVKPPYYKGGADRTTLENWIREFEKLFVALKCPDDMKVDQAALYLKEDADLWWKNNSVRIQAKANFNWDTFTTALRDKFYPPFLKKQKSKEFYDLQMKGMSVDEYYKKFNTLARFAPEVVSTEALKAQRFEQGLTIELQMLLGGETFTDLDTVYGRATQLYSIQERKDKESSEVGEKRKDIGNSSNQGNLKKPRNENFGGKNNHNHNTGGFSRARNNPDRHYYCKWCNKDHPGTDCKGNLVTCRFCQKRGHREFECLTKKRQEADSTKNNGGPIQPNNQGDKPNGNIRDRNNNTNNQAKGSAPGRMSGMSRREAERSADMVNGEEFSFGDF